MIKSGVENVYIVSSIIKNRTSEVMSLIQIVHKFNQWLPEGMITSYTKNTDINFREGFLLNDTKTIISPSSFNNFFNQKINSQTYRRCS